MNVIMIKDRYNDQKIWVIKRYKCGHYYANQEICGRVFYRAFRRISKRYYRDLFTQA